ncbi:MAG TPA: NAD(+) synthase [Thermotogota bacterium]|nr:NAD(+) synthase [Thermotogota bacterium]
MQQRIVSFLRQTIEEWGYQGAVVGISGGIDSAVVAALAVQALGKQKVIGLLLPERDSAPSTLADSLLVCNHLGIAHQTHRLSGILRRMGAYSLQPPAGLFPRAFQEKWVRGKWDNVAREDPFLDDLQSQGSEEFLKGLAFYRAKHRVRLCMLYLHAEQRGYAVLGTTNRTELRTGFYVKWGDDSSDIEPILHLYKTQVFALARALQIPESIIQKSPSPDLIPGITDEFALKLSYEQLDDILIAMDEGKDLSHFDSVHVQRVRSILQAARHRSVRNLHLEVPGNDQKSPP